MRKKMLNKFYLALVFCVYAINGIQAQDSVARESILNIKYFSVDNKIPYLLIQTQSKLGKKYTPVKNVPVKVFIGSDSSETNLLGNITTSTNGAAKVIFPASVKATWDSSTQQNFIASAAATKDFDETKTELVISKSKIMIDTSSDEETKNVTITVTELKNGEWLPVKDVEMRIGIKRLSSILPVGDEETYTTDSTGQAMAEFAKDSLPGDAKGNLILVAKIEDNETYGNLIAEKTVPWGVNIKHENILDQRTLWSTGNKAPGWLLLMAILIIVGVWGTLIYLIFQLFKIRRLNRGPA